MTTCFKIKQEVSEGLLYNNNNNNLHINFNVQLQLWAIQAEMAVCVHIYFERMDLGGLYWFLSFILTLDSSRLVGLHPGQANYQCCLSLTVHKYTHHRYLAFLTAGLNLLNSSLYFNFKIKYDFVFLFYSYNKLPHFWLVLLSKMVKADSEANPLLTLKSERHWSYTCISLTLTWAPDFLGFLWFSSEDN